MTRTCALCLAVATLGLTALAAAQPTLRVRGQSRIALDRQDGHVVGELRDDRGDPIAGAELRIVVRSAGQTQDERVQTDRQGRFQLPIANEVATIEARYEGDAFLMGHSVLRSRWSESAGVQLELLLDGDRDLSPLRIDLEGADVHVEARASGHGLRVVNELGAVILEGRDAIDGNVARERFGEVGTGLVRLEALAADDSVLATRSRPVVRFRQPTLTLARSEEEPSTLVGELRTQAGALARRAVSLESESGGRRYATVLTDADGRFTWAMDDAFAGERSVVAVFSSTGPETPSARSTPLLLEGGGSFSLRWLLWLPLVLCAFFLLGTRAKNDSPAVAPVHGVTLRGETTREPTRIVAGRMTRAPEAVPLGGVLRAMLGSEIAAEYVIGDDGAFSLELPEGTYELVFLSPGFASEFFPVAIPHRGQRLEVQLERWRQRAARILFDTFERIRGRRPQGATVHDLRRDPKVGELATQVEVVSYGPGTRDGASVGAVQEQADRLQRPPKLEGES